MQPGAPTDVTIAFAADGAEGTVRCVPIRTEGGELVLGAVGGAGADEAGDK